MSISRYALGAASLLAICGSLSGAAFAVRRHYLPDWTGAIARLAESVIGFALLTGILEVLGTVGLFRLGPIVAASVLIGWWTTTKLRAATVRGLRGTLGPASSAVVGVATATVIAEWAGPTLQSYDVGMLKIDTLWYHLPWAASFAQTGQITPLQFTGVEYLTTFYPATAELFHGLGIVLLGRDTLSPGLNLLWLGLMLLAAYCIGRPKGVGPVTLLGAALAMATPMMDFSQAGSAANDVVGVFFLLASVALLVNSASQRAPLVLAAVAAGLAIAVKLTLFAPVLALSAGVLALSPPGRRRARGVLWLGPLFLAGGFWYARNLVAVGNPFPWFHLPGLATPAAPLQQHTAFSIAHYLSSPQIVSRVFEPGLASDLGAWWTLLLAAAVLGPLLCVLSRADRTTRVLGLVALASLGAYLVTPETAAGPRGDPQGFMYNLRYAAPALTLSLAILPLAPPLTSARMRTVTLAALSVLLAVTVAQARLWPNRHVAVALPIGALVLVACAAWRLRRRGAPLTAGLAVLLAALTVGGWFLQRHYLRGRYAFRPGVSQLARTWAFFRHVHHARVGIVGTFGEFFSYPLYGLDDSNRVQYVGQRGPHGSFTAIGSCRQWRAAVNAGRLRYLVTTPSRDPWHQKVLSLSPEGGWTAIDTAARVVHSRQALGQTIAVFELRGPLQPASCP